MSIVNCECWISGRTRKEAVGHDGLGGFVSTLRGILERETGLEPATACLEGRNSTRLSYSRLSFKYTNPRRSSLRFRSPFHAGVGAYNSNATVAILAM